MKFDEVCKKSIKREIATDGTISLGVSGLKSFCENGTRLFLLCLWLMVRSGSDKGLASSSLEDRVTIQNKIAKDNEKS